jgi:hypothetical protein
MKWLTVTAIKGHKVRSVNFNLVELTLGSPEPLVDAQRSGQVKRLARQVLGAITDAKLLHLLPDTALGDRSRGY